ncbi:hypothetical protein M405DRAFT_935103 [Rhizopogon salebrosus TDB-379]|nr:hypothetical protein M405DRAFT_935103 [Rhizopogon salebrosus TDB-379]
MNTTQRYKVQQDETDTNFHWASRFYVSTQSLKVTFPSPQRTTSPPTSAHPTRHPISLPSPTTIYVTPLPPTPPYVSSARTLINKKRSSWFWQGHCQLLEN